jgi:hemerythrin
MVLLTKVLIFDTVEYMSFLRGGITMIEWKDTYAIGIDLLDTQHRRIFDIGNRAYALLKNDFSENKHQEVVEIFESLIDYIQDHFKSEEDYMLRMNYPKYFVQKLEHDNFLNTLNKIDFSLIRENQGQYLQDQLNLALNWFLDHIIEKDMLISTSTFLVHIS